MQIGVDFSGVIVNSDVAKVATARRFLGIDLDPRNTLWTIWNEPLDRDVRMLLMTLLFCTSELLSAPPIEGAIEHIFKLQSLGARLSIVSNINPGGMSFATHWLRMHGLRDIQFVSVGIGSPKSNLLQYGFTVFIDDKLSNLLELEGVVPLRILFAHAYNETKDVPTDVVRAKSWQEVLDHIMAYAKSQEVRSVIAERQQSPAAR